jgi:hypothetical protein
MTMLMKSEDGHRFNNDLLINSGDVDWAERSFPDLKPVLSHPALQDAFERFDRPANDAKKRGRISGLTAIALGTISLIVTAATPKVQLLALAAAICGVVSIAVGLGGALYAGANGGGCATVS